MATQLAPRLLVYAFLAGLTFPSLAHGQWPPQGMPICTAFAVQRDPGVVPDGSGGAVIFWVDRRTGGRDIYAQRVTANGQVAPGWPSDGAFLSGRIGELAPPMGIPDGTGGVIVVWEDERDLQTSNHNIYAQRVTGEGTIAPGWPLDGLSICTAPNDQRVPQIIPDGSDGAIITWQDARDDPGGLFPSPDIYALRIMGSGALAPGWSVNGIPICTTPAIQGNPTLASDDAGGAIITWADGRNLATTGADIYAQRVDASGEIAPGWVVDGVAVSTEPGHQNSPETVSDGEGGALVIWEDARTDPDFDVYAQRIRGEGTIAPGWPTSGVPLSTARGYQFFLSAAADGQGGVLVAWEDYTGRSASDIFVQRVTGEGAIPPGWPVQGLPVAAASGFQLRPQLAPDGTGGAFVVWEDTRSGTNEDLYAQHVTASGGVAPGWEPNGVAICTQPTSVPRPAIAPDGLGGAIMAWSDLRNANNKDIFAQKLTPEVPVPAVLSLVEVDATFDRVILLWHGDRAASLVAVVERFTEAGGWRELGSPVVQGDDRLRYEDSSVIPGERYAYRLSYSTDEAMIQTAEVWIDVPGQANFALEGFRPNPARGAAWMSFSLGENAPARVEVFDLAGRRQLVQEVGALGPGRHLVQVGRTRELSPGIYWIRLTQGARSEVMKGIVSR